MRAAGASGILTTEMSAILRINNKKLGKFLAVSFKILAVSGCSSTRQMVWCVLCTVGVLMLSIFIKQNDTHDQTDFLSF